MLFSTIHRTHEQRNLLVPLHKTYTFIINAHIVKNNLGREELLALNADNEVYLLFIRSLWYA